MIAPIDMNERNPKDLPKNERKGHDLIGKKRVRSLTQIYLIFLGPKKTETNVHDIFYTKHCLSDISGLEAILTSISLFWDILCSCTGF